MKVGIMTMHRILNYGSFMQALSLKKILEEMGQTVEFIDFKINVCIDDRKDLKKKVKRKIKQTIFYKLFIKYRTRKTRFELYEAFKKNFNLLGITEKYKYRSKVDLLIIGSDEVFNCLQTNADVGYSLELFGKSNKAKKVISYAASFGHTTLEGIKKYKIENELSKYLNKFYDISIRDKNSYNIVKSLSGITPKCNLDPVLVGNIENLEWKSNEQNNYIAVYGYANRFSEEEGIAIKKLANSFGMETIAFSGVQKFCDKYICCSPDEIIPYFKNSNYVITDTFHGVIFSVICHKQFAVFCRNDSEKHVTNQEKLMDLLEKLGLTDRLVRDINDLPIILKRPIDYKRIDDIRKKERERTIEYLKNNLE